MSFNSKEEYLDALSAEAEADAEYQDELYHCQQGHDQLKSLLYEALAFIALHADDILGGDWVWMNGQIAPEGKQGHSFTYEDIRRADIANEDIPF